MAEQALKISLRKKLIGLHKNRRREKAVDYLREQMAKRMHVGIEDVKIDKGLNRLLQYKSRHMSDFSVTLSKEGSNVLVKSAEQVAQKPAATPAQPAKQSATTAAQKAPGQQKNAAKAEEKKKQ